MSIISKGIISENKKFVVWTMQAVADVISIPDELKAFAVIPCGYPVKVEKQQDRYDEARVHFIG